MTIQHTLTLIFRTVQTADTNDQEIVRSGTLEVPLTRRGVAESCGTFVVVGRSCDGHQ